MTKESFSERNFHEEETLQLTSLLKKDYLKGLNPEQIKAVEYPNQPLLILAGAGTGKTRVLTTRIAQVIHRKTFPVWSILAVTFTNKAAREMKERIETISGVDTHNLWLGTFHSIAGRMLRRHAEYVGLKNDFTIINSDDSYRLIRNIHKELGCDEKKLPPKYCNHMISRWKDKTYNAKNLPSSEISALKDKNLVRIFEIYNQQLLQLNAADFGDLLCHVITICKQEPSVLQYWQQKFKMILVDEYQDTNIAQYYWLRLLAQDHHNITCVGDDDQSIYGWRGAEIDNILKFEKDFTNAKIIRLEQNYRSTPEILKAASTLIHNNEKRLGKQLWTEVEKGENICIYGHYNNDIEAEEIAADIIKKYHAHISLNSIAVLIRTSAQSRALEAKFNQQAIDYQVIGGAKFFEREEIRDVIAYLRILSQEFDGMAFSRIINKPTRGIGLKAFDKIRYFVQENGTSYIEALRMLIDKGAFNKKQKDNMIHFLKQYDAGISLRASFDVDIVKRYIEEMGLVDYYRHLSKIESEGKIQNINEFYAGLHDFSSLQAFLDHIALISDNDKDAKKDCVSIMTIHGAKGLEFDHVHCAGMEEGLFPNQRVLDESGVVGLEEERRLAYVAFTRARKTLSLHFALNRRLYGQNWTYSPPSRFLDELPKNVCKLYIPEEVNFKNHHTSAEEFFADDRRKPQKKSFTIGDMVTHSSFGPGIILDIDDEVLHINFEKLGEKRILSQFVHIISQ